MHVKHECQIFGNITHRKEYYCTVEARKNAKLTEIGEI